MRVHPINLTKNPFRFFYYKSAPIASPLGQLYHLHQGMELYYLHEGKGKALIENKIIELEPGMLLYIAPFQLHGFSVEHNRPGMLIRSVFEFDPLVLEPYVKPFPALHPLFYSLWKKQSASAPFIHRLPPGSDWRVQWEAQLAHLEQARLLSDYEEHFALTLLSMLKRLQPHWLKHYETPAISSRPQTNAEYVMEWIDRHYQDSFSMKALSKDLHLSEKYISTLFRKATGTSISEYIMAKRLKHACRLLASTTEPIEQIAYDTGLSDFSYFCQFFKKQTGLTPSEFRRQFTK